MTAAAAAALRIGGLTPFTSIDHPGKLAAVVFVQGCPWRCAYCHNPHLQARRAAADAALSWPDVLRWLQRRAGLLDAVVFSGGEPTSDPALPGAMAQARALGYAIGLHTGGLYPRRLAQVLPLVDWVGLDIKAPLADGAAYDRITGRRGSAVPVRQCLALLQASAAAFECRTTAHPALLDERALGDLADGLAAAGVANWALQVCRRSGAAAALPAAPADYPGPAALASLGARFARFTVRPA